MNRIDRLRAQIQAVLATALSAQQELDDLERELVASETCSHPEDDRVPLSTFGQQQFRCKRCGVTVTNGIEEAEVASCRES
jgi:hypothetical protein